MLITVDTREEKLYSLLQKNVEQFCSHISIQKKRLDLGDIIISTPTGKQLLIIERKTLTDLSSSIKDKRYIEQSFRLNGLNIHNHSIIYLIEGDFGTYKKSNHNLSKPILLTTMFSLNYYKGFSLLRTFSIEETCQTIFCITDKLHRMKYKHSYYNDISNNYMKTYSQVIKRAKKANITTENIGEIMLSQIPKVSSATAKAIMKKYKSIKELMKCNIVDLKDIKIKTKTGKDRRISKKSIENIQQFLINL